MSARQNDDILQAIPSLQNVYFFAEILRFSCLNYIVTCAIITIRVYIIFIHSQNTDNQYHDNAGIVHDQDFINHLYNIPPFDDSSLFFTNPNEDSQLTTNTYIYDNDLSFICDPSDQQQQSSSHHHQPQEIEYLDNTSHPPPVIHHEYSPIHHISDSPVIQQYQQPPMVVPQTHSQSPTPQQLFHQRSLHSQQHPSSSPTHSVLGYQGTGQQVTDQPQQLSPSRQQCSFMPQRSAPPIQLEHHLPISIAQPPPAQLQQHSQPFYAPHTHVILPSCRYYKHPPRLSHSPFALAQSKNVQPSPFCPLHSSGSIQSHVPISMPPSFIPSQTHVFTPVLSLPHQVSVPYQNPVHIPQTPIPSQTPSPLQSQTPVQVHIQSQTPIQIPQTPVVLPQTPSPLQSQTPVQVPIRSQTPVQVPIRSQTPVQVPIRSQTPVQVPVQSQSPVQVSIQPQTPVQVPIQPQTPIQSQASVQIPQTPILSQTPSQITIQSQTPVQVPIQPQTPVQISIPSHTQIQISIPSESSNSLGATLAQSQPILPPIALEPATGGRPSASTVPDTTDPSEIYKQPSCANEAAKAMDIKKLKTFAKRFQEQRESFSYTHKDVAQQVSIRFQFLLSEENVAQFEAGTLNVKKMSQLKKYLEQWILDIARTRGQNESQVKDLSQWLCNYKKNRRQRTLINKAQREILEEEYLLDHKPDSSKLREISKRTEISVSVLRTWYCNRRQKNKLVKFESDNKSDYEGSYSPSSSQGSSSEPRSSQ